MSSTKSESESADTTVERGADNRWKLWILIHASRRTHVALFVVVLFVVLVMHSRPSTLQKILEAVAQTVRSDSVSLHRRIIC